MATEEEFDAAMQFVVNSGTIRIRTDTAEWRKAAEEDITALIHAVYTAAPKGDGEKPSESSNPPNPIMLTTPKRLWLNSNTAQDLYMEIGIDEENHLYTKTVSGTCSYNLTISGGSQITCHWAILRGNLGELCILMGADSSEVLDSYTNPSDYHGEDSQVTIRDNLCRYTSPAFFIVHTMDSLYNETGFSALLIPCPPTGTGSSIPYEEGNEYSEFETYIDISGAVPYSEYRSSPPSGSIVGFMPKYYMVAGDHMYYAKNHGDLIPDTLFSSTAPTYNLTAIYSPTSRCVSCTSLLEVWGNIPDPDGSGTTGIPHLGPEVITMGSSLDTKYYLRSGNIFVPVPAPQNDPATDDNTEEETDD